MKRIAAVYLPQLACEIARHERDLPTAGPLAILITDPRSDARSLASDDGSAVIAAVCERAHALGLRPGMRVAEATARARGITFVKLLPRSVLERCAMLAEILLEFGHEVESDDFDTLWVDTSGVAHLFGGEESLLDAIEERMAQMGHRTRVALADGPRLAAAVARHAFWNHHAEEPVRILAPGSREAILQLPLRALPLTVEALRYFSKLGISTLDQLSRMNRKELTARLGTLLQSAGSKVGGKSSNKVDGRTAAKWTDSRRTLTVSEVLGFFDGIDVRPLVAYQPPDVLVQELSFADGVESAEQLIFALRRAVAELSARLIGRRQATHCVELLLEYDRTIFRLQAEEGFRKQSEGSGLQALMPAIAGEPRARLVLELIAPLSHTDDIFRAIKAKVEQVELLAPAVHLTLRLSRIVRAPERQLDLSRQTTQSPDALPALLSELSAEFGSDCLGVLAVVDDHRPERASKLMGLAEAEAELRQRQKDVQQDSQQDMPQLGLFAQHAPEPMRLLPEPIEVRPIAPDGAPRIRPSRGKLPVLPGMRLQVGREPFEVQSIDFERRLDGVAWHETSSTSRDYYRVTLRPTNLLWQKPRRPLHENDATDVLAWLFVDRKTGDLMLHGYWE